MDWTMIVTLIAFQGLGLLWVYTYVTGKDIGKHIGTASELLDMAVEALGKLDGIVPSGVLDNMLIITEIARTAAANAEQLWKNGSIDKDTRKHAAIEYAVAALEAANIEVTPALRKIVEGAIEAACLLDIPHST